LTLSALGRVGKVDEAQSWLDWLKMISLASGVEDLQIRCPRRRRSDNSTRGAEHSDPRVKASAATAFLR
jgi:hypothetical protein